MQQLQHVSWGQCQKKLILIFFPTNLPILRQWGLGEIFQVKICLRRFVFEIFANSQKSDHFVCLNLKKCLVFKLWPKYYITLRARQYVRQFDTNATCVPKYLDTMSCCLGIKLGQLRKLFSLTSFLILKSF